MDCNCGCAYPHFGCSRVNLRKGGIWGKVDVTCYIVGNVGITEWNDRRVGGVGLKLTTEAKNYSLGLIKL